MMSSVQPDDGSRSKLTVSEYFFLDKTKRNLWNDVIFYPDEPNY